MSKSRTRTLSILVLAATLSLAAGPAAESGDDLDARALHLENSRALPHGYQVTLSLFDGEQTHRFSAVTASRHFTLSPAELRFEFRGRLALQRDGRELLDFTVELQQQLPSADGEPAHTRVGSWKGSTYVETGRAMPILENPRSKLTVKLDKL